MNISLNPELEELINRKIQSGDYHSAAEVISEGLRLLKEQDELKRIRLEELKREISIGLEQANRGECTPLDIEEIKAEGRKRLIQRDN
jgi:antitoxin ParD1/3/4